MKAPHRKLPVPSGSGNEQEDNKKLNMHDRDRKAPLAGVQHSKDLPFGIPAQDGIIEKIIFALKQSFT